MIKRGLFGSTIVLGEILLGGSAKTSRCEYFTNVGLLGSYLLLVVAGIDKGSSFFSS